MVLACMPLSAGAEGVFVIAAFGDSLFAGLKLFPQDSFPDQLERRLKKDGYDVNVINFGLSGDTIAGGLSRIDRVIAQKPHLAFIELGANDIWRNVPVEEVRTNLDQILSRFHEAGIPMLVIGQREPFTKKHDYDGIFCDLARHYDAPCYPVFLKTVHRNPEWMLEDGVHPNPQGVKVIVDDIYPMVVKRIKSLQ